jgi:SAM-dependent methyltransferase
LRRRVTELTDGLAVLDVGCGFGANHPACGPGYLGIDVDATAVEVARKRYPSAEFRVWDLQEQGPPPGRFDAALLCLVLHEAERPARLLDEALDPGWSRILVLDFDPALRGWLLVRESLLEWGKLGPYRRLPLVESCQRAGWRLADTGPVGGLFRWWDFRRGAAGGLGG